MGGGLRFIASLYSTFPYEETAQFKRAHTLLALALALAGSLNDGFGLLQTDRSFGLKADLIFLW